MAATDIHPRPERLTELLIASQQLYHEWESATEDEERNLFKTKYQTYVESLWEELADDLRKIALGWKRSGLAPDTETLALALFTHIFLAIPKLQIDPTQNVRNLLLTIARRGLIDDYRKDTQEKSEVTLQLEGNPRDFDSAQEENLLKQLSDQLGISPDQLRVIRIIEGSIKITIELPDEAASILLSMFISKNLELDNLKLNDITVLAGLLSVSDLQSQALAIAETNLSNPNHNITSKKSGFSYEIIEDIEDLISHKISIIKERSRRLHLLELEQARKGSETSPHIMLEMKDLRNLIKKDEDELNKLKDKLNDKSVQKSG